MMPEIPWNLQGIDPDARANAEASAQRAGVNVSQWLNSLIRESSFGHSGSGPQGYPYQTMGISGYPAHPHAAPQFMANSANGYGAGQPYPGDAGFENGLSQINSQIGNLSNRLDALARAKGDTAIVYPDHMAVRAPQSNPECGAATGEDGSAIREIEQTLKNIVDLIEVTDTRTKKSLDEMRGQLKTRKPGFAENTPVEPDPGALFAGAPSQKTPKIAKTRFETRRDRRRKLNSPEAKDGFDANHHFSAAVPTQSNQTPRNQFNGDHPDFVSLAHSLEAALEKSNAQTPGVSRTDIEALKGEVRALAEQVTGINSGSQGYLASQQALQKKLEELSAETNDSDRDFTDNSNIDQEFHSLHSHLENITAQLNDTSNVSGALTGIEQKLSMLFDQLQQTPRTESNITDHNASEAAHLLEIEHKVGLLFDQLQQSQQNTIDTSRQIAGETAQSAVREATQEAVRVAAEHVAKYLPERISGNEVEIVRNLEAGLNEVRASATQADQQTQKTLNAVQDSLHAIMDRLTFAESEASETAAPLSQIPQETLPLPGRQDINLASVTDSAQHSESDRPATAPQVEPATAPRVELELERKSEFPNVELPVNTAKNDADPNAGSTINEAANPPLTLGEDEENIEDAAPESVRPLEPGSGRPVHNPKERESGNAQNANASDVFETKPAPARAQAQPHARPEPELQADTGSSLRNASTNEELLAAARRAARNAAHDTGPEKPAKKSMRERFRRPRKSPKTPTSAKQSNTADEKIFGLPRKPVLLTSAAILLFVGSMKIYGMMANNMGGGDGALPASVSSPPAIGSGATTGNPAAESSQNHSNLEPGPVDPANLSLSAPMREQGDMPDGRSFEGVPQSGEISSLAPNSNTDITGSLPGDANPSSNLAGGNTIQAANLPPVNAGLSAPMNNSNAAAQAQYELPPEAVGTQALRQAAADGNAAAQFEVASRLAEGRGLEAKPEMAVTWYQRAAAQGLAPAQYRLGSMYEKGRGLPQDRSAARIWYQRAAELGNRKAMHNLAVLYADGIQGEPDMANAARWFRKAANFGLNDSQFNLGILYARGLGVPRNNAEAYKWLSIAAANGDAGALQRRDAIANELDQQTLAATRLAIQTWRAESVVVEANTVRLPVDGWGEAAANSGPTELPGRDIIRNSQKLLSHLGFDVGPADGVWGPRTRMAITQFQGRENLPQTGQLTPQIFRNLQQASARNAGV